MRLLPVALLAASVVALPARAASDFAFKTFAEFSRQAPGKNLVFSPYSLATALRLAELGARGATREQLRAVLGQGGSVPASSGLQIANRLWLQGGYPVLSDYVTAAKRELGASSHEADFAHHPDRSIQLINRWVATETHDKIPSLIPPRGLDERTRAVLTNAVYFKSAWREPFRKGATEESDFDPGRAPKVRVPLMRRTIKRLPYAHASGAAMIELAYGAWGEPDPDVVMDVLLPDTPAGLAKVEKGLDAAELERRLKELQPTLVDVALPRFKVDSAPATEQLLQELGIHDAFDAGRADFTGISTRATQQGDGRLFISAIFHKAFVAVDEQGTEAAAATAVAIVAGAAFDPDPPKPVVFRADHPFVFLLRHRGTGEILFLGRIVRPEQKP